MYETIRFCTNCGLDSKYIPPDDTCEHHHLIEKDGKQFCTNCGLFVEYELIDDLCIARSYYAEIQENKAKLNKHSKVKDLREAATKAGVKRVTAMSKKQLCKALGIKDSNEVPALKKDHRKVVKHEQRMFSFLANEMDKAGREIEAHVVRTIVKPHIKEMGKEWEEMTAMQKFKAVERKF